MEASIRVEGLRVDVDGFSLEAGLVDARGPGVVVVSGGNGSGKTLFLRALLGLVKPSRGRVKLCGVDVTGSPSKAGRCASYMPQDAYLMATHYPLTPLELLEYSMRAYGLSLDAGLAVRLLEELGLDRASTRRVMAGLAPGERQRVFLARAILAPTPVVMLDEPFNALDERGVEAAVRVLSREASERLVVVVVHGLELEGLEPSHRIVVESGRVVQVE